MQRAFAFGLAATFLAATGPISAATFTVTSTADSGAGSLRQAILDANGAAGADTIAFNIAGAGVHTIVLGSALPAVDEALTIDGYSRTDPHRTRCHSLRERTPSSRSRSAARRSRPSRASPGPRPMAAFRD